MICIIIININLLITNLFLLKFLVQSVLNHYNLVDVMLQSAPVVEYFRNIVNEFEVFRVFGRDCRIDCNRIIDKSRHLCLFVLERLEEPVHVEHPRVLTQVIIPVDLAKTAQSLLKERLRDTLFTIPQQKKVECSGLRRGFKHDRRTGRILQRSSQHNQFVWTGHNGLR